MLTLARPANRPQRITSNQTSDRWRKKRLQRLQFVFIPSSWFQFFCAGVTLTSDFLLLPSISSLLVSLPPHCASPLLPPPSVFLQVQVAAFDEATIKRLPLLSPPPAVNRSSETLSLKATQRWNRSVVPFLFLSGLFTVSRSRGPI